MNLNQNKKPNFLIVGAAKSGTTSLYAYLKKHQDIYLSETIKETFFLTGLHGNYVNSEGGNYNYGTISNFEEYCNLFKDSKNETAIGEICVGYLYFFEKTIPRIKKYLGDPKIIIILRSPIDRAYSNYLHHVRDGFEKHSFEEALNLELTREMKNYWWGYQFRKASLYYTSVKSYLENFSQVKIILFDDFVTDTKKVVKELLYFLNVDSRIIPDNINDKYNVSGIPRFPKLHYLLTQQPNKIFILIKKITRVLFSRDILGKLKLIIVSKNLQKKQMDKATRIKLINYFENDIKNLSKLLKRDLSHWLIRE